ncbi:dTDP-4-dehydrorhamnose reductase [Alistipes indistinctus]|jgi:dTDP-4-dehydrorhamnose reductase|uniref:dTDP-4-dehydrorhamnose reductase n=1 Tax=Alistipes indistinctus TaxID=626932 RepID=UPI000E4D80F1|nr:dTDP-4-dehydrorhamnose reductase [Alistipes indistinctus]RGU34474.1 dTDP-4-dehydrorhamnose reductase [Alistipes indistinctus]
MNILVTGANGQLGQEMRQVSTSSTDRYIFTDVAELDITDAITVKRMVRENNIKVIVNCAAYTDVDRAEDDVCMAELLNATAVRYLAEALKANDGILIHVSTDYVFGSTQQNTPYKEDHPVNPTGVYGLTKLHGEQTIANVDCHHIIIRTAWLYSEFGKNFVKTMLQLTAQKPQVKVVFDQVGTPTYAYDLAATIFNIVENRQYEGKDGIYHFSNEGVCSWFDFAKMIVKYAGHTACDIRPCHSSEFSSKVHRPSYSVLDKTKIKEAFGIQIPYWTESLQTCIEQLKNKV